MAASQYTVAVAADAHVCRSRLMFRNSVAVKDMNSILLRHMVHVKQSAYSIISNLSRPRLALVWARHQCHVSTGSVHRTNHDFRNA